MKNDNASPMASGEYDRQIANSMPYYREFLGQILDILQQRGLTDGSWLDLGCGTGTLAALVHERFPQVRFTLADPSESMLELARRKLEDLGAEFLCAGSEELPAFPDRFQVATAVQCHHYLRPEAREKAVERVFTSLSEGGIFLYFENIVPEDGSLMEFEMRRWASYRVEHGFPADGVEDFLARCGVNYFPISIPNHLALLRRRGFRQMRVFWQSYLQAGIYAIK
ncbi:MAG: class I SAM-dependent methyltransferase [Oscillospiraceae bacterium]|nr:class I SAM-dependent methyltransferase [Oscillospiraceae bacterium]